MSSGNGRAAAGSILLLAILLVSAARPGPASGQAGPPSLDDLIAKAARQGSIRVIVEVRPEAGGPPSPEAIAQAQDLVLQELTGTDHRVLRRYRTVPFLSLTVSTDALRRLAGSLFVSGIREDTVLRPQR
jgi:hypothetical protein